MSRLSEIYNGWINLMFSSKKMEELAETRFEICNNCDELRKNNTCKLCGCYMPAKVRSRKSKCVNGKW